MSESVGHDKGEKKERLQLTTRPGSMRTRRQEKLHPARWRKPRLFNKVRYESVSVVDSQGTRNGPRGGGARNQGQLTLRGTLATVTCPYLARYPSQLRPSDNGRGADGSVGHGASGALQPGTQWGRPLEHDSRRRRRYLGQYPWTAAWRGSTGLLGLLGAGAQLKGLCV